MKSIARYLSIALCVLLLAGSLFSCESRPLKPSKDTLAVVGQVGDYDVLYEELYVLASTYAEQLVLKYGEDAASSNASLTVTDEKTGEEIETTVSRQYEKELKTLVYENIVANYAILSLCDDFGITAESEELDERVQLTIDSYVQNQFGGKRSQYLDYLKDNGVTDHYLRFTTRVDLLYGQLLTECLSRGYIESDAQTIRDMIPHEFARTWHIMILNGDHAPKNLERAEEALAKLESGEKTMYQMIGSTYNDDLMNTSLNGYYFAKGTMNEAYEDAAFGLEIGQISGIVASVGEDANGMPTDCYYIIQRMELENEYIEKNLSSLITQYQDAALYGMVEKVKGNLSFSPNEYGASLDLDALTAPKEADPTVTIIVGSVTIGVVLIGGGVTLTVILLRKKNQRLLRGAQAKLEAKK